MGVLVDIPALGPISDCSGCVPLAAASDGVHRVGHDGVVSITPVSIDMTANVGAETLASWGDICL